MSGGLVQSKLIEMIDTFRHEFDKLSDAEKQHEQLIDTLRKPCQIHIISSPDRESYLFVITRFPELQDKMFEIIDLSKDTFIDQLESFLNRPIWTIYAKQSNDGRKELPRYIDQLQSIFIHFGKSISGQYGQLITGVSYFGGMSLIDDKCSVWNLVGDLQDIDFRKEALQIIDHYKASFTQAEKERTYQKPEQIQESIPERIHGYGTYFYPPILVGEYEPTIRDQILNREYELLKKIRLLKSISYDVDAIDQGICLMQGQF